MSFNFKDNRFVNDYNSEFQQNNEDENLLILMFNLILHYNHD